MYDDGQLINEEMVGRVDHNGDIVEVILLRELVVRTVECVLAERTRERRTHRGDPAVEGEELLNGRQDRLFVHVGGIVAKNTARGKRRTNISDAMYSLWFLEPLPIILHSVVYDVLKEVRPLVTAHADLKELVFARIK